MSYTMTFDASHKVGRGGHAQAFFRHIARDLDQAAGFQFTQANKNIVPDRTRLNLTVVNDGEGGFRKARSVAGRPPSDEFDVYLKQRLSTVDRKLRKDAVLMRGLILQLDPRWFEEHNPSWRAEGMNAEAARYMGAALDWACAEFGQANVVGWSVHLDEVSPQLQVMVTPITDDGRLSQKDFFKGPADLKRQHKELRDAVAAVGYDVEYRVTERSREHLSSSEFQAKADRLRDAAQEAERAQSANQLQAMRLLKRKSDLDEHEARLADREQEARVLSAKADQAAQDARVAAESALRAREAALHARRAADNERHRMEDMHKHLEEVPADVDRWLDKVSFGGQTLRSRFDADMAKLKALRREALAMTQKSDPPPKSSRTELEL
ncbi:plasmid recombination protein [Microbacterium sp. nov. GSS16]|uniref:plasmid recombination protein n=1 Tax=Microbacterium sp. nov. GSS16 TaxID=3019890 RepID=UPI002304D9E0|nr:plasmid recombination protein [Microbacterium sp. nov. GSS16]WCD91451.1 plasmid recombination protein [Microbacterium sp. nov. GSS16]